MLHETSLRAVPCSARALCLHATSEAPLCSPAARYRRGRPVRASARRNGAKSSRGASGAVPHEPGCRRTASPRGQIGVAGCPRPGHVPRARIQRDRRSVLLLNFGPTAGRCRVGHHEDHARTEAVRPNRSPKSRAPVPRDPGAPPRTDLADLFARAPVADDARPLHGREQAALGIFQRRSGPLQFVTFPMTYMDT